MPPRANAAGEAAGTHAVPRSAIVALAFAAFGSAASMRVTDALLPRFDQDFGIGLGTAAHVVTAFAIAYGIAQVAYGAAGDHWGKYRLAATMCIVSALTTLACAFAPRFGALVVARFVAGATVAAIIPLAMAWLGDVIPYERRQPVLARFLIGQIFGLASGQFIGGLAADFWSWRAPFVALALWFALSGILLLRMRARVADPVVPREGAHGGPLAGFRYVLGRSWARRVVATVFLEGVAIFGPFAFFATHLHRNDGVSLAAAGAILVTYAAGGFVYSAFAPFLVRRLGEAGLAAAGAVMVCIALLTIALATLWPIALLGAIACGLGFYMLHNTLQTNATQMAPQRRGSAIALFALSFFGGQSVGVALAGSVVERVGTTPVIVTGALAALAIGLVFSRMLATHRLH